MGVFLDRVVCEDVTVKQKPKICEGDSCAEFWGESIPVRRRSLECDRPVRRPVWPERAWAGRGAGFYSKCDRGPSGNVEQAYEVWGQGWRG